MLVWYCLEMKVAPEIHLSDEERQQLKDLTRKGVHSARKLYRARILLMANTLRHRSGGDYPRKSNSNQAIADELGVCARTVSRVRQRYLHDGLAAALSEAPRSGHPVEMDGEAEAKLVMLACSDPPEGHAHWTLQLLADRMVGLGYVDHISDTWVGKRLKKTNSTPGRSRVGRSRG